MSTILPTALNFEDWKSLVKSCVYSLWTVKGSRLNGRSINFYQLSFSWLKQFIYRLVLFQSFDTTEEMLKTMLVWQYNVRNWTNLGLVLMLSKATSFKILFLFYRRRNTVNTAHANKVKALTTKLEPALHSSPSQQLIWHLSPSVHSL